MSIPHRVPLSVALCVLVSAALLAAAAGVAHGATEPDLYAVERAYSTYAPADTAPALATEQYLQSYGEPQPLSPPPPLPSDDTPWLPIALSITGLVIVAASATQLRRLRLRRRRAIGSAA
jgi:hypothetical protein